jgi:hypothetical protein
MHTIYPDRKKIQVSIILGLKEPFTKKFAPFKIDFVQIGKPIGP